MPKSRGFTICEHCKATVPTGARYVVWAGRTWRVEHLDAYQARRLALKH